MGEGIGNYPETEPRNDYTSRELLHFFRHDDKEKDPEKSDEHMRLTPSGRIHAHEQASIDTNINQSVAFGSPRERAQETAGHIMAGGDEQITGNETLEELKSKLDAELGVGSKIGSDRRLDFTVTKGTVVGDGCLTAYGEKRTLEWLVNDSDKLAAENNDTENTTYSKAAKQVAEIVLKYLKIAPRWDKLVESGKYNDKTLERFLGSHQSILESFLAKVVEITKGIEERDRLVGALNKEGFGFSEGFEVEIRNKGSEQPILHLKFRRENSDKLDDDPTKTFEFDENIATEVIEQITSD